ncbi:MAG TPA: hypothetical protein VGX68_21860 [Thermoanaerobaculia bacterium]|jgi:tetratricopeptide (TPR) repeat protein|nr:hypothetical protein [Thermoanaerobaculia bacterium]
MSMVITRSRSFSIVARWGVVALVGLLLLGLWLVIAQLRESNRPNEQETPAAPSQASYRSYMGSAASLEGLQQVERAAGTYAHAVTTASSKQEAVEAQLAWAGLLSRNPGSGNEAGGRAEKADELYQSALEEAEGDQQLRARNDYGVFLFRQGQTAKAAAVLGQIDHASWSGEDGPVRQARYLYNYGQVLEDLGRTQEAYSQYLEAMRLDPRFGLAREAATRLVTSPAPAAVLPASDQMRLVKEFLGQRRFTEADGLLRELAAHPDRLSGADSQRFADLFLSYLIDSRIEPTSFKQTWEKPTERLQAALPSPAAEQIREIRSAFLADLPVEIQSGAASGTFRAWRDAGQAKRFSELLKTIGDDYGERGNLHRSLERYSQAATLDPTNAEPALYLTNLLVEHSAELDPKGELLDRWLRALTEEREDRYALKDPEKLLYLHSLLGAHFEKGKRWGPEDDPQTALYQWRRALEAQSRIPAAEPELSKPRPLLNERLAFAYEGWGEKKMAAGEYRTAARGYEELKDDKKAVDLFARADILEKGALLQRPDPLQEEDQMAAIDEDTLPGGASPWPLIALGGLLCLLAAITIRIVRH